MAKDTTNDITLRNAKAKERPYKISDGGGLFLLVTPAKGKNGKELPPNKWWRFKYRFDGKEKGLSFGTYPEISLSVARKKRDEARAQVAMGIDPALERKAIKKASSDAGSFEFVAREWHAKFSSVKWSAAHSKNILSRLEKHVFPWIGSLPIGEIKPSKITEVVKRIEATGHLETLHRTLSNCGQIFGYAITEELAESDPTYRIGKNYLSPSKKHFSAILDPPAIGALMRAIAEYHGDFIIRCALLLAPLVLLRPGELRLAEWAEIDLDRGEWIIPIGRMKRTRTDKEEFPHEVHFVPLSKQAVEILRELHPLTGSGRLVFPGMRGKDRAISDASMTNALRRMGYGKETIHVHGFRAMGRTLIREQLKISGEVIERQLSHAIDNPLGKAYDRTTFIPERKDMMQKWADYLERLTAGAEIIPIRAAK